MDDEKKIEVKYKLNPEVMKVGASKHYDFRLKIRKWILWLMAVFLICLGLLLYDGKAELSDQLLSIFFVAMGVIYLFNKLIYVRRTTKAVFVGKENEINVKFTAKEDGYDLKTDDSEGSAQWKSIINYHFFDDGILLYPQKNLFYFIPIGVSEISGGTWDEFTAMIQRNVEVTIK